MSIRPGTSKKRVARSSGFTLQELLVVVIFVAVFILLVIGPGACPRDLRQRQKTQATKATINTISKAVEMYHIAHKVYPTIDAMPAELYGQMYENGKEVDDYEPGPGYRLKPGGTVYGPWNEVDQIKRSGDYEKGTTSARVYFMDAFNQSIWYCPFDEATNTYTDPTFPKNESEDGVTIGNIADYAKNQSGKFYRRDYIIMSQSANGKWGLFSNDKKDVPPTDDVTNFKE